MPPNSTAQKNSSNINMATPEDRTLMSGITIPQWMKGKKNSKFDLDPSTFSPTESDDSFMLYYRHPSSNALNGTETNIITSNLPENIIVAKVAANKIADFSQHPGPCQKFLQKTADVSAPPQTTPQMKIKSAGTDDGFKGEAAQCGSSIVRVASQMVLQGFGAAKNGGEQAAPNRQQVALDERQVTYDGSKRRGSRSLPASPLTSPKTGRRATNKYFTAAFAEGDKPKGGWILSNLLATRRDISQSVDLIEETKDELERASSTASVDDIQGAFRKAHPVFKAKPSELREMNFWSPTSM